jgi:cytosine deaminase
VTILLRNATLAEGKQVDVRLADTDIEAVAAAGELRTNEDEQTLDLSGSLLLPALAEPHAHLDKALTADRFEREFTDLMSAIAAWETHRETLDVDDIALRARRGALLALAHGVTAIRTHADVGRSIGLRAVEALLRIRNELRDLLDIQVVALAYPLTGTEGAENRARLREALAMGVDVVGGGPHADEDPPRVVEICLEVATEFGRSVDLHADENMRPSSCDLVELIRQVSDGFAHKVTASHSVSLGIQPPDVQARVAAEAAAAGVAVVTLPIANLYLQGRDQRTATPRGFTALPALLDAGAIVAAGGDNVQDPFVPLGSVDPLMTAQYLVCAAQLPLTTAYELVGSGARTVMGLPCLEIAPGFQADLVAVAGSTLREVIAMATEDRLVFRRGKLVSRTRVVSEAV